MPGGFFPPAHSSTLLIFTKVHLWDIFISGFITCQSYITFVFLLSTELMMNFIHLYCSKHIE
jgi:hypothetical protein